MENFTIEKITLAALSQLQEIGRQTFYETFVSTNTQEDMQHYLTMAFAEEKLQTELTEPQSEFYVAKTAQRVVGYLKVNVGAAQTELKDPNGFEIERIYVLQEFHGKRVGQLLYSKALQLAQEKNMTYVWLGVWEHNARAIQFYKKNGFVEFGKHIFKLGNDEQTDIMMRLTLPTVNKEETA